MPENAPGLMDDSELVHNTSWIRLGNCAKKPFGIVEMRLLNNVRVVVDDTMFVHVRLVRPKDWQN